MIDRKDPILREIEQALAIDHSADLEARIRRRVSAMPAPVSRRWRYVKLGAAFAAACVAVAVMIPMRDVPQVEVEDFVQAPVPVSTPDPDPAPVPVPVPVISATPAILEEFLPQADIVDDPAPEVYVSDLQAMPVPVFELAIAPLPEMTIDAPQNVAVMLIEPFRLASPNSGEEE